MRTNQRHHARPLRALLVISALSAVLALAACSGVPDSSRVATLESAGSQPSGSSTADGDSEKQLIDFVECMREQGVDLPDPQVDADGNLQLGGGPGAGGPGGAAEGDRPTAGGASGDRDDFQAAAEACGGIPEGAFGGGRGDFDPSEIQDAALEFAQCMRGEGIEVPDPDFSGGGASAGAGAPRGRGGGFFGDLDMEDPDVQAALEACQGSLPGPRGSAAPS